MVFDFCLVNQGPGPGKVNKLRLFFEGKEYTEASRDPFRELIKRACHGKVDVVVLGSAELNEGYYLAPGDKFTLFKALFPGVTINEIPKVREALKSLQMVFEYESLYKVKGSLGSRGSPTVWP